MESTNILTIFQVNVWPKVHFTCDRLENQTLLSPGGEREFNLSVKTTGTKQGGIQSICTIRGHNNLKILA
jgi:hypothetical protein